MTSFCRLPSVLNAAGRDSVPAASVSLSLLASVLSATVCLDPWPVAAQRPQSITTLLLTNAGKIKQVGSDDGLGYTINLPLPGDSGHVVMQMVLDQIIRPAASHFQPDLVLVSAGGHVFAVLQTFHN